MQAGLVRADALADFIARAFVAVGMPHGDARTVATLMPEAEFDAAGKCAAGC